MELRKLEQNEHNKTRALWKNVFSEDTKAFLDYYYFFKTRDNVIYVIEEDDAIRSMLQLNPYRIHIGEEQFDGHYVIAVATEEGCRRRGYMRQLLCRAMQDMYDQKELFTFLMPASEKIYTPYDFRFMYDQNVWMYTSDKHETNDKKQRRSEPLITVSEAGIGDGAALADFFNAYFAGQFQVYAVRTEAYYQTLLFEQQSENGGIKMIKNDEEIVGVFLYGNEDGLEIREPLYLKKYESAFWNTVDQLCKAQGQGNTAVYAGMEEGNSVGAEIKENKISGEITKNEKKPTIMARILHLERFLKCLKAKKGKEIDCSFAVLDALLPQNSRVWRLQSKSLLQTAKLSDEETEKEEQRDKKQKDIREQEKDIISGDFLVRETEDSEGVLTIAALTSILFGYKSIEEAAGEPDVYLTEHLMEELKKIQPFCKIYLNEIV